MLTLTQAEIALVAGGAEPVCTIQGSGTFTFANGTQLNYTAKTINSDGSTTLHLAGGGTFTFAAPSDPRMVQAILATCD